MVQCSVATETTPLRLAISRETWVLGLICAADMIYTIILVRQGRAVEGNRVLSYFMDMGMGWFVFAKSLLFIAPLFALELIRTRRPEFVKKMLRVGIAGYLISYGIGVAKLNMVDHAQNDQIVTSSATP